MKQNGTPWDLTKRNICVIITIEKGMGGAPSGVSPSLLCEVEQLVSSPGETLPESQVRTLPPHPQVSMIVASLTPPFQASPRKGRAARRSV